MIQHCAGGHRNRSLDMFLLVCRVSTRIDDEYIVREPKFVEFIDTNSPRVIGGGGLWRGGGRPPVREKGLVCILSPHRTRPQIHTAYYETTTNRCTLVHTLLY